MLRERKVIKDKPMKKVSTVIFQFFAEEIIVLNIIYTTYVK